MAPSFVRQANLPKNNNPQLHCLMQSGVVLFLSLSLVIAELPDYEKDTFSKHGEQVDNFIVRTLNRISDAWTLSRQEFDEAALCMQEESKEIIKVETEKQRSWLVEEMKKKSMEMLNGEKEKVIQKASGSLPAPEPPETDHQE